MEFIKVEDVVTERSKWEKIYKKNLIILTEPLHFNPEPINENYYSLLYLYKKSDIFDLTGLGINVVLDKLLQIYDSKTKAGIHIGYLMPIILYIIETLKEIESRMRETVDVDIE